MDVNAEGPTFVLELSEWMEKKSIFKHADHPGTGSSSKTKKQKDFEVADMNSKVLMTLDIKLAGIGISLVDEQELMYISATNVDLTYRDTSVYQSIGVGIKWLQVGYLIFSI